MSRRTKKKPRRRETTKQPMVLWDAVAANREYLPAPTRQQLWNAESDCMAELAKRWAVWMGSSGPVVSMAMAESMLRRCMDDIEYEISHLAKKHSKYFWFCLARRIPPWPEGSELWTTQMLFRSTFELALLKHGSATPDPFIRIPNGIDPKSWRPLHAKGHGEIESSSPEDGIRERPEEGMVPASLAREDWVDLYKIRGLAKHYYRLTALLRRIWKGETLQIAEEWFDTLDTQPITQLIEIWDRRASRFQHLGSLGHPFVKDAEVDMKPENVGILIVPNTERADRSEALSIGRKRDAAGRMEWFPNYLPHPIDCETLEVCFRTYGSALESYYHVPWQHLFAFVRALIHVLTFNILHAAEDMRKGHVSGLRLYYGIMQRGYLLSESLKEYAEGIYPLYEYQLSALGVTTDMPENRTTFDRLIDICRYPHDVDTGIDLWNRSGRKYFIYAGGDRYAIDYAALRDMLNDILSPIGGMDGAVGNLRGEAFPEYVKAEMEKSLKDITFWGFARRLKFQDGTEKEVDIGVQRVDTLFVVECANMHKGIEDDQGRPQAIQNRLRSIDLRVTKVDGICSRMAGERCGRNWSLDDCIRWVVPVVTTPFVEYLCRLDEQYWLTAQIPRICTPAELLSFMKDFQSSSFVGKPWLLPVGTIQS